ncbi:hypothetical protein WPS_04030 [Vulcanimicrobium alpinum]|uniref:CHRD domain-containing protein n=1 Tax=Vulcanimicrobium alpinum TaxID=3016050 RepID=A0AAN2C917_UNVUL|nr:hypothetical protein [Vulcanimicrobium alpinum]BDE05127.1 hypothetical protein WPS_04030 [Vulcanimicrobium alpinum]
MRSRIAMIGAAFAAIGLGAPALALNNPLVAPIRPVNGTTVHGNVTLFQLGGNVQVGLNVTGTGATPSSVDVRKGTCSSYAQAAKWPLGTAQETRLPNTTLQALVGDVVLIHKTSEETSPVVGCAAIKG